ncbi:MAG: FixH family protein [Nitrospiraceae bacterium]|nr:MAG: FixH family protein [Nitrospiraceae bacterium]
MIRMFSVLAAVLLLTGVAYASHFITVKETVDLKVKATIDSDPLKVGTNNITVELFDAKGNPVIDADVTIYYFMPSMPAMNYEIAAVAEGGKYRGLIKPTMPGEWEAYIRAKRGAGDLDSVTISFSAK